MKDIDGKKWRSGRESLGKSGKKGKWGGGVREQRKWIRNENKVNEKEKKWFNRFGLGSRMGNSAIIKNQKWKFHICKLWCYMCI